MSREQEKAMFAKQNKNQASIDSKILSHQFGSSDITAKGDREYVIHFGNREYELLTNKKIDNFENNYPEAKLDIIPKDKKFIVKFKDVI